MRIDKTMDKNCFPFFHSGASNQQLQSEHLLPLFNPLLASTPSDPPPAKPHLLLCDLQNSLLSCCPLNARPPLVSAWLSGALSCRYRVSSPEAQPADGSEPPAGGGGARRGALRGKNDELLSTSPPPSWGADLSHHCDGGSCAQKPTKRPTRLCEDSRLTRAVSHPPTSEASAEISHSLTLSHTHYVLYSCWGICELTKPPCVMRVNCYSW